MIYGLMGCLSLALWLMPINGAWASAIVSSPPAKLFEIHCAGCHPNGTNIIRRGKNLKLRALNRHGYGTADEIATLITHGKGLMSAYGDQLSTDDINHLATYVLDQAAVNWKPTP